MDEITKQLTGDSLVREDNVVSSPDTTAVSPGQPLTEQPAGREVVSVDPTGADANLVKQQHRVSFAALREAGVKGLYMVKKGVNATKDGLLGDPWDTLKMLGHSTEAAGEFASGNVGGGLAATGKAMAEAGTIGSKATERHAANSGQTAPKVSSGSPAK